MLSRFSITQTLYAVCGAVALVLLTASLISVRDLRDATERAREIEDTRMPQLLRAEQAELSLTRASLMLRHAMLARTDEERRKALSEAGAHVGKMDELLAAYEKNLINAKGREVYSAVPGRVKPFKATAGAVIGLIEAGQQAEAFAKLADELVPLRNDLLAVLAQLKDYQGYRIGAEVDAIGKQMKHAFYTVVVCSLLVVAGLVGTCMLVGGVLRGRAARATRIVNRVAAFDLRHAVLDRRHDEFTDLLAAMKGMQDALTGVVLKVRDNADAVATASSEIADGNLDLSQRTEQQSSNLQRTASTMDELSQTVRQNADNAKEANALAQGASDVAQRGGDAVGQVVDTMRGISEASRRITEITGVIDGIAFQTNILALNAAVEAARAGDSGRGFAVVAGEVRLLAQRSAEAAREIKSLITASVEQVDAGARQADNAGRTMGEVVDAIRRVSDIVGEISSASAEQSQGIQFVGQAVSQMDQATQQNAALVEQSAAAAESLRHQSRGLVDAVGAFQLDRS